MEVKLTKSKFSGTSTVVLVLSDTACANSWVSDSLATILELQGTALKFSIYGINTEEFCDKKLVKLAVTTHKDQDLSWSLNRFHTIRI